MRNNICFLQSASMATANQQAKESSKEEECAAICQLRGVPPGSSIALQLKAIDEEYHHLVQSGQSARADKVQELFAWKSKRAHSMVSYVNTTSFLILYIPYVIVKHLKGNFKYILASVCVALQ